MRRILIVLGCMLCAGWALAVDQIVPPSPYETNAATPTYQQVTLVAGSTTPVTIAAMTRGVYRIITNNSLYTIRAVADTSLSTATIVSAGTPIYSHEHFIDDRWYGRVMLMPDPTASGNCDVIVEQKARR